MNRKIIILLVILTLVSSTQFVSALNMSKKIKNKSALDSNSGDIIEINCGKVEIFGPDYPSDNIHIDLKTGTERPYEKITLNNQDEKTIRYKIYWSVVQDGWDILTEQFEFILKVSSWEDQKNSDREPDRVTLTEEKIVEDFLFDDKKEGDLYVDINLDRSNFEGIPDQDNEYLQEKFRIDLNCTYYQNKNKPSEKYSDELYTYAVIEINNNEPSKPTVDSDISNGGTISVGESYSFTASGSTDQNGDDIRYHFFWGEGPSDKSEFMQQGPESSETKSHIWTVKNDDVKLTIVAQDIYGKYGDYWEINFAVPKLKAYKKEICLPMVLKLAKFFPQLTSLINL